MTQQRDAVQDAIYRENGITYLPAGMDAYELELDPKLKEESVEFDKFRDEMTDSEDYAKITVARQPVDSHGKPAGRKLFQCFEAGIDDYTFSQLCTRIRNEFGTGLYKIQGRDSKGKFKFHKTIGIQAPKRPNDERDDVNNLHGVGSLIDRFSDAMERQQQRTEMMLREMMGPRGSGDPMDQLTKMATVMGTMMQAFQPKQTSLTDQLKEMMLMKKFMNDLSGDSEDSSNTGIYGLLSETVKNFGPLLTLAVANGKKSGQLDENGIVQSKNPALLSAPTNEKEQPAMNPALEQHKQSLQFLLTQAKAKADVNQVVDFVLNAVPDDQLETLETFLAQENCIDLCVQVVPEFKEYRAWLAGWRSACINELAKILDDGSDIIEPETEQLTKRVDTTNNDSDNAGDTRSETVSGAIPSGHPSQ